MKLPKLFSSTGAPSTGLANFAIVVSIIVVANLLVHLAIPTFYSEPTQHGYCQDDAVSVESVEAKTPDPAVIRSEKMMYYYDQNSEQSFYIERDAECVASYQTARTIYERNAFMVMLVTFIVLLIVGLNLQKFKPTSYGLIYGSLVLLISGTIRYWDGVGDYWRLGLLAIALAVLVWLGVRAKSQKN